MSQPDQLASYQRKRDFARTPEPGPGPSPGAADADADAGSDGARRFVVQRHRARRLHYDFRLEIDGVLVSWAVPKGPTLDAGVRRAAFHVEDHPMAYRDFEGVIPSGQYGGGDVIVWDAGTWEPRDEDADAGRAVEGGELHFDIHGEKLRGRFALVRTRGGRYARSGQDEWLMLHKRDEYAVTGWDAENYPNSVLSGRTNDQVKADPDRMWRSDLPAEIASVSLKTPPADDDELAALHARASDKEPAASQTPPGYKEPAASQTPAGDKEPAASQTPASDDELAALQTMGASGTWEIFGRRLRVTNLDKVLFPGPITKRDFLDYTARIAPTVTPYLTGRALNMHRYPNGAETKGFWQKELPSHAPDWLTRWTNPDADPGETQTYLVADEPAALLWAANFGALEWHPWTSRVDDPDQPTYVLLDLDPGTATSWDDLLTLARLHRTALDHLGVTARAKVTGRRGIQIWIPVAAGLTFDETRAWAQDLSRTVGAVMPDLVSWKWQKSDRGGLARLDYTQNAVNRTLVAPYSPRPAPGAPVSAPIDWDELDDPDLRPDGFTIRTILPRLAERGDLFRDVLDHPQQLPKIT